MEQRTLGQDLRVSVLGLGCMGMSHGYGLGTGTIAEGWLQDAVHFWQSQSGATAIRSAKANTRQQDSVYSLNGIGRNTMQRGINIVDRKKIIH